MKRVLIVLALLCLSLSACKSNRETIQFYYLQQNFDYSGENPIILPEAREAPERRELSYLLAIYLMGPSDENLCCPLPSGTKITVTAQAPDETLLELSPNADRLEDAQYAVASACLAYTCMELTGTQKVTTYTQNRSISLTRKQLTMSDHYTVAEE